MIHKISAALLLSTTAITAPAYAFEVDLAPLAPAEAAPDTGDLNDVSEMARMKKKASKAPALMTKPAAPEQKPAPVADLIKAVDIPYEEFTLDNGLRVITHTDRKAPVVAVSVWYGVGSKHEPKGKTGFAHLFEHLMFNGSENAKGDFFEPLQQVGATDFNGTTWFDRTNYFETVPTGALDLALFLESDRMGHLLGGITQEKLDNQRGVVQNEKRQGDNNPYGLVEYEQLENLYPSGHPYHHSTIGSMADLDSASLADVKQWFVDNYGPNNSILVLAGDIDAKTAKPMVEKWFGDIKRGPQVAKLDIPVPTLEKPMTKTIKDQVASTRIYRMWAIPGLNNSDNVPLAMAGSILGGLSSSRLDNALVRENPIAVSVSASADIFAQGGQFVVRADVKDGVDPAVVAAALDAQIAKFMSEGPTQDEIQRATTRYASEMISGLESVGGFSGKAPKLAEGLLYSNNISQYKVDLERAAKLTPAEVKKVTNQWLSRPVFSLIVEPGERTEGGEKRGGFVVSQGAASKTSDAARPAYYMDPNGEEAQPLSFQGADRSKFPEVGTLQALDFPAIERGKLSNGIEVIFARRTTIPKVQVTVSFDVGYAADPKDALGTQSFMLAMMDEGTSTLDSRQLAEVQERLGATISSGATGDNTNFSLSALTPNLLPSLNLLVSIIRDPAFDAKELERTRAQQLNQISSELKQPTSIALRKLIPELYGAAHPYGIPPSGLGNADVVKKLTRSDLMAFHQKWLRPDSAKIYVVGDTSLKDVMGALNKTIGRWAVPASAKPQKNFSATIPKPNPRILLIDRPKSPQSFIAAGKVLPLKGSDSLELLRAGNEVLGGSFLSRMNSNLRETKGWSYGVRSQVTSGKEQVSFIMYAPVQSDRTGDSIAELLSDTKAFLSTKGVTPEELTRTVNGNVRELPGSFETSSDVMGALQNIENYDRPDDYYEKLADTYRGMTTDGIDAASRKVLSSDDLVFVVVGDASVVSPQLQKTGLPVEIISETATPGASVSK
jgi:zinc protease